MSYLIAVDEGTTSARAMLYSLEKKEFVYTVQEELEQFFPHPAWVEQDAGEIYAKVVSLLVQCIEAADEPILGIGLTNQRETVVLWNKKTGRPLHRAIVWQCRRTSDFCDKIGKEEREIIFQKTGLPVDAYFSASKIKWLLDHVKGARELAERGELCCGTVDSYLIYKLTDGREFFTDYTNASRTMLFNINTLEWDKELLDFFDIPEGILPRVGSCTSRVGEFIYQDKVYPIAGIAGDQQSALFGQGCFSEGQAKITYGTGMFLLFPTGKERRDSKNGLITTIGYSIGDEIVYAMEGSVFHAGSTVKWLRDELGFFRTAAETEALALSVEDTGGVYLVPAFTGLGAPYWRGDARAIISGISRGTDKRHITRAGLEAIAYSARTLTDCMEQDSGISLKELRCDGGASANNFLMQFQSDVLHVPLNRPKEVESTALGVVYLCALALGIWNREEIEHLRQTDRVFVPSEDEERFDSLYRGYQRAVKQSLPQGE